MHRLFIVLCTFGLCLSLLGLRQQNAEARHSRPADKSGSGYACQAPICDYSSGCVPDNFGSFQIFPHTDRKK